MEQYRIQTAHFKKYFNGENNTYIEDYFDFKEKQKKNLGRKTLVKHKTHLNQIWKYIIKNKKIYGLTYNVVTEAQITTLESDYEACIIDILDNQKSSL